MGKRQRNRERAAGERPDACAPRERLTDRELSGARGRLILDDVPKAELDFDPEWPKDKPKAKTIDEIRAAEAAHRAQFAPAPSTTAARRVLKGRYRRTWARMGRPEWAGGAKPAPGVNPAVLAKRERASEAARAELEAMVAKIDADG